MPTKLNNEDQELLREELDVFGGQALEGQAQERLAQLAAAVDQGVLSDDALDVLGVLLEVGLQSGEVRRRHRAAAEQRLLRLFGQTPAGKARASAAVALNAALGQLSGQQIESVRVLNRLPGHYLLHISTEACEVTLRFTPDGSGVESVAVGI
jgi:hypothetical protein